MSEQNSASAEAVPMSQIDTDSLGIMVLAMLREIAARNKRSVLDEAKEMIEAIESDEMEGGE